MLFDLLPQGFLCVGCLASSWKTVCKSCKEGLLWNDELLPSPVNELEAIAPLIFSFSRSQKLIRRFKENGGSDLKRTLFQMRHGLRHKLQEQHFFAIVPIPQDTGRSYIRGHESAYTVSKYFSRELGIPILSLLTLRERKTKRLTGLQKFEREWAENPFQVSEQSKHHFVYPLLEDKIQKAAEVRLLLVDDLITSGSTLSKASATLKEFYPNLKICGGSVGFRPNRRFS